ncbi:(2Fe-2S)-binding protein [Lutibacter sp. HS1-25]|uniref:(2Fe-2S)-binding protein n=1 Tax=Lutibacter sp. HS1-25 TaxID=2485000 RepID=UPI0010101677|nr:(2Fe-2S)-binding protein [Lutibacter sp. HS1-25]RXP64407.1 (2Fe-2S)-binding protein [Lutibacter sp. HS1-25]
MSQSISFKLNGEAVTVEVEGSESLLNVIRENLDKTGTKFGCGLGDCGACTVVINNEAIRSCMLAVETVKGQEILTIEDLESNGNLHPLQQAFIEIDALQCGFCTPGMIMNAYGLLLKNATPTRDEIIEEMEENLCRCGSYNRIIEAIQLAGKKMNSKI